MFFVDPFWCNINPEHLHLCTWETWTPIKKSPVKDLFWTYSCDGESNIKDQHLTFINHTFYVHTFYQPDEDVFLFNDRYFNGELDVMFSELNVPFCVDEIVKACKKLNSGKSAGSDYWLNEFFKYGSCCNGFVNVICVL